MLCRFDIRLLAILCGQKFSSNEVVIASFGLEQLGLTAEQVYNTDESGLLWELLLRKPYVYKGQTSAPERKIPN